MVIIYGYYMVILWLLYGYFMVIIWLFYGYCMVILWLLYGYFMVIIYGYYMVIIWLIYMVIIWLIYMVIIWLIYMVIIWLMMVNNNLVGGFEPPLWKIWVREMGSWHSQYDGKNHPVMFQTTSHGLCCLISRCSWLTVSNYPLKYIWCSECVNHVSESSNP